MFERGQRVRCAHAQWFVGCSQERDPPAFGADYTVAAATVFNHPIVGPTPMIELVELPPRAGVVRIFQAEGFRALGDAEFERLREVCLARPTPLRVRDLAGALP